MTTRAEQVTPAIAHKARTRGRVWYAVTQLWRTKALWLGLLAFGLGVTGQQLIVNKEPIIFGTRWYAASIVLVLLAWAGTYKNKSTLLALPARSARLEERAERTDSSPRLRERARSLLV